MRRTSSLSSVGLVFLAASVAPACGASSAGTANEGAGDDAGRSTDSAPSHDGTTIGSAVGDGSNEGDGVGHQDGGSSGTEIPVDLASAGRYVILAKTGISAVSPSTITGDVGLSPAAASYITGFSLIADSTNVFATSSQVTGKVYAADYATPTPTNLTAAIGDMGDAFSLAAGRAPDVLNLGAGAIGGMTLSPGVYRWGTGLLMATDVTLSGDASDVWVFQVAKNLTVSNGAQVHLARGALPKNVFWQVSGGVTLGANTAFDGTILCQTAITVRVGATITGRLLAQTAVTLDANTIVSLP